MADTTLNPVETKKPWQSKTIVLNGIMALLGGLAIVWPGAESVSKLITENSAIVTVVWSILNIGLRLITKDKISLGD